MSVVAGLSQEKIRFEAEPGLTECTYRPPQTGPHEERHNRNILRRNGLNTVPRAGHFVRANWPAREKHGKNSHFHLRKLAP